MKTICMHYHSILHTLGSETAGAFSVEIKMTFIVVSLANFVARAFCVVKMQNDNLF